MIICFCCLYIIKMHRVVLTVIIACAWLRLVLGYTRTAKLISLKNNEFHGARGILQVRSGPNEMWRYINASTWDLSDAIVACKDLGYLGLNTYYSERIPQRNGSGAVVISNVYCNGTETQLQECLIKHDILANDLMGVAALSCTGFPSVRLTGMGAQHQGRVEVFYNGTWGGVCDDYWDQRDGEVVCKQLRYPGLLLVTKNSCGSPSDKLKITMKNLNVNCTENDSDIRLCKRQELFTSNCQADSNSACVICKTETNCPELPDIFYGTKKRITRETETMVFEYKCWRNAILLGSPVLSCSNGRWNDTAPICVPSEIQRQVIAGCSHAFKLYSFYNVVSTVNGSLTCGSRYYEPFTTNGLKTARCTVYGVWERAPTCLPIPGFVNKCILPWNNKTLVNIGQTIKIRKRLCHSFSSYSPVGPSSLTCVKQGDFGEWNGAWPQCIFTLNQESHEISVSTSSSSVSVPPGVILGVLGVGLFLLIVIIFTGCIARRVLARKRNAVETETLHNLSTPLVVNSDGEGIEHPEAKL